MFVFIVELSRITHPIHGSVLGTMPAEHLFSLTRRLCSADQRAEALGSSFEWSILGVSARLDRGRELCEDVTFQPPPGAFVHTPFDCVLTQSKEQCVRWASPSCLLMAGRGGTRSQRYSRGGDRRTPFSLEFTFWKKNDNLKNLFAQN
jgi:hypothetical protein